MKRTIVDWITLIAVGSILSALGYVVLKADMQPAEKEPDTYDGARRAVIAEAGPQIEALLTRTTGAPTKCVLEPTLWAVLTPGVKFEGMVACRTNGATYHTQIYVTRYANDDGQLFWQIGDLQRTEPK